MVHPLVPDLLELAAPLAASLDLEVVDAVFQTNQSPPVLRIDVRNLHHPDTSLDDCERMSQALDDAIEASHLIPDAYVLEVSSPGVSPELLNDRDFTVFKGFMVEVSLSAPHRGKQTWIGQLLKRDERAVVLTQKGKSTSLPRELVTAVVLSNQSPD